MKIYIVRHGETQWNKEEIFRGRQDVPLNERGKEQATKTASFFQDKGIKRIFSSPLSRAFDTARTIGDTLAVPVTVSQEFNDMAFGRWEGLTLEEVEKTYRRELDIWRFWPQKFRITGAENLTRVRKRIIIGLRDVFETDGSAVIVTHRVICKVVILHLLGVANEHFWKMKCDPACISLVVKEGGRSSLHFLNETCHLKGSGEGYGDF